MFLNFQLTVPFTGIVSESDDEVSVVFQSSSHVENILQCLASNFTLFQCVLTKDIGNFLCQQSKPRLTT